MFKIVLLLLCLVVRGAIYVVIASAILSMVRTFVRPRWGDHVAIKTLIAVGELICTPARLLLEAFGVSSRPFDFSPLVTTVLLEILLTLLSLLR